MQITRSRAKSPVTLAVVFFMALGISMSTLAKETTPPPEGELPLDELRTFAEVFNRIKVAYVNKVSDKTLLENAIRGMLEGLDPHSDYLTSDDFHNLKESTSGEFGGLGIEVGMEDGFVKVIAPIDDTPAQKAGVQPGDLIIKINGQPIKGMSLKDAVDKMRGKPGEKITLTLLRGTAGKPEDITLTRAVIKVKSVRSKILEPHYGYLRITQFQVDTGDEVIKALKKLKKENKGKPLQGLVLDLRNNPGGVLQAAVKVVNAFMDKGLIVYTKGRIPNSDLRYNASGASTAPKVPMVVLINGGSASASEIVAGALQDHHRAIVMGTDSFGKGSVQTILPLNDDNALKLTTALYYTPNGRSIQAEGIEPDIVVEQAKLTLLATFQGIKEADLAGHLDNSNGSEADKKNQAQSKKEKSLGEKDYQLYEALSMLKGLFVTQQQAQASSTKAEPKAVEASAKTK